MLPGSLNSTYRRYKDDTDAVASWLASTAKTLGFPVDRMSPHGGAGPQDAAVPSQGRLKGKARKEAKTAHRAPEPTRYTVAIKDFVPLAQFIASKGKHSAAVVPPELIATLARVIDCRSKFGKLLVSHGSLPNAASDSKHDHFIQVLKSVKDSLRQPRAVAPTPSAADPQHAPAADITNRFKVLDVEEPSVAFEEAWSNAPDRPQAQEADLVKYEAQVTDTEADILMAYALLLQDVHRIRVRIGSIWKSYRNGTLDLGAAATATNAATSLARGIIEDVEHLFPRYGGGLEALVTDYFHAHCHGSGIDVAGLLGDKGHLLDECYDEADATFVIANRIVARCASEVARLSANDVPLLKDGPPEPLHVYVGWSSRAGPHKRREDERLGREMTVELLSLHHFFDECPFEDELIHGMKQLAQGRNVTFSLTFTVQILLDTRHILGDDKLGHYNHVRSSVGAMEADLIEQVKYHENVTALNTRMASDLAGDARRLLTIIQTTAPDPVHKAKVKALASMKGYSLSDKTNNLVMKSSPVIAGLWLQYVRVHAYPMSIDIVNFWAYVVSAASLYNFLQKRGLIHFKWPDMELLLAVVGEDSIWVGGVRPDLTRDCRSKLLIQLGFSSMALARDARRGRGKSRVSKTARRRIKKNKIPVSIKLCDAITMRKLIKAITTDDIVALIAGVMIDTGHEEHSVPLDRTGKQQVPGRKHQAIKKPNHDRSRRTPPTPDDMIKALTVLLQAEATHLSFPYLAMHRVCLGLLRAIRDECSALLDVAGDLEHENDEGYFHCMVVQIMDSHDDPDMKLMKAVAAVMSAYVDSEKGSRVARDMRASCCNNNQYLKTLEVLQ
jgi:hypothetical protein